MYFNIFSEYENYSLPHASEQFEEDSPECDGSQWGGDCEVSALRFQRTVLNPGGVCGINYERAFLCQRNRERGHFPKSTSG